MYGECWFTGNKIFLTWQNATLSIQVGCTSQGMIIRFINAVLDMHRNEAMLLQIIRQIGKRNLEMWIWFQIWTYMLYPGIFYGTKLRILAYITLQFYSSMTLLHLSVIVKRFTVIRFMLAVDHAKLLRIIVSVSHFEYINCRVEHHGATIHFIVMYRPPTSTQNG